MKKTNCAIYCRLSKEDYNSIESSSISNQKEMLIDFAKKNDFTIYDLYIDDGYSGGNFNRPGWTRLINDIENKKINIVITKDLSRLGRDYIGTGYYTEEYFPKHQIRYIAINDNYDSINKEDDITPFKNIINQWYLKDLSKKVKTSHEIRMKKGNLPKGNIIPLFGYKHTCNNERIIDENSSKVVKKVFELYNKGLTTKQIKERLIKLNMTIPSYYNYLVYNYNSKYWTSQNENKKFDWNYKIINYIISNKQYTGTLELKKTQTVSYKTHQRIRSKDNEKYIFNNRFPAIISQKEYNLACEIKKGRVRSNIDINENIFQNIIFCSNCNKPLSLIRNTKTNTKYYVCRNQKCKKGNRIKYEKITEIVFDNIKLILDKIIKNKLITKNVVNNHLNKNCNQEKLSYLLDRNNKIIKCISSIHVNESYPELLKKDIINKYLVEYNENLKLTSIIEDEIKNNDQLLIHNFILWLEKIKTDNISYQLISALIYKITLDKHNSSVNIKFRQKDDS